MPLTVQFYSPPATCSLSDVVILPMAKDGARLSIFIRDEEELEDAPDESSFKATLVISTDAGNEQLDVVCQIYNGMHNEKSQFEAETYIKLLKLQGDLVPRFYGLYTGIFRNRSVSCLVREDCGEPLGSRLTRMSWSFKRAIVAGYHRIHHEFGTSHNALENYNIIARQPSEEGGEPTPVIIDWSNAIEHDCEQAIEVEFDSYEPSKNKFGCDEIYGVAKMVLAWRPANRSTIRGEWLAGHDLDTYNVDAMRASLPPDWSEELVQKAITTAMERHDEWNKERGSYIP